MAVLVCGGCRSPQTVDSRPSTADADFNQLADEYLAGYLAWRPPTGTGLGFHEYDGKLTDFSRASLDGELARLKSFDQRLAALNPARLSAGSAFDRRILSGAIKREIFGFEQLRNFSQNPMTYAGAVDVSVYIKRDFAPLEERAASVIAILRQTPSVFVAARANLEAALPQPFIETAIEQAEGAADFLAKDLVTALKPLTNGALLAEFNAANQSATNALRGYAAWLKAEKLPHANQNYALGREKYRQLLEYGEGVKIPPEKLLEIGLRELHRKQEVFAENARQINAAGKPIAVFKAIQRDHPTETSLIPDTARNLEMIRQFVVDRRLITLPSTVRAQVAETPQFLRATSFASMDSPGPFETKATEAYYYVTPTEPDWSAQQKDEWLTAFNYYTTDIVSIHEVYPGHYVQFLCLKASPATKVEKIFGSYAFIEGWAHYAEQMMVDEGFGASATDGARRPPPRGQIPVGPGRRGLAAALPVMRLDPDALPGHERRAGNAVLRQQLLLRAEDGAAGGDAGHIRSRVPVLHVGQAGDLQAAGGLPPAGRGEFHAQEVPQRITAAWRATPAAVAGDPAQRSQGMGPGVLNGPSATGGVTRTIRKLSVFDTVCLGVNAIIGSGIFIFPGRLAEEAGPASILAFAVCGLVLGLVALCYAELGSMFRQSGGPYVYATEAFGPWIGFGVGWVSWVTLILSWAAVASAVASGLAYFFPIFAQTYVVRVTACLVVTSFGLVNYFGIKLGARTINAFTVAKLAPLLVFVLVGCCFISPANYRPFWHAGHGSFGYAVFLSLWALQGFEVTPFPSGESADPEKAVPVAALGSLAATTVLYVLIQAVAVGVHPGLASPEVDAKPLADAAARFLGRGGGALLALGAVISTIGYNAGDALGCPRLLSALAEGKHLPALFAQAHPRFATPWAAILATTGLTACAAACLSLTALVDLSNLVVISQYVATCSAVFWLRVRRPDAPRRFRIPAGKAVAVAGCAVSIWLAKAVQPNEFLLAAGVIGLGFGATAVYRWRRTRPKGA